MLVGCTTLPQTLTAASRCSDLGSFAAGVLLGGSRPEHRVGGGLLGTRFRGWCPAASVSWLPPPHWMHSLASPGSWR